MARHVKEQRRRVAVIEPGTAAAPALQEMTTSPFRDECIPAQVKGSLQASERGRKEAEG